MMSTKSYFTLMKLLKKEMIKTKDELQKEAIDENCSDHAYKCLRNIINSQLPSDEIHYYRSKFYQDDPSISATWRNVNDYLKTSIILILPIS